MQILAINLSCSYYQIQITRMLSGIFIYISIAYNFRFLSKRFLKISPIGVYINRKSQVSHTRYFIQKYRLLLYIEC